MLHHSLFLLGEFTRRDFKGRYAGSVMGFLWSFVQPLWSLALFTFLFSTIMKVSPGIGERTETCRTDFLIHIRRFVAQRSDFERMDRNTTGPPCGRRVFFVDVA